MADQDLPELQPAGSGRGKQIVFLFMSAVVAAVIIFLLGVSVGRGVRRADTPVAPDAGDTSVAATTPPPSSDLNYHNSLRGGTPADPPKVDPAASAAPVASPPSSTPPPSVNEAPSTRDAKESTPSQSTRSAPSSASAPKSAAASGGGKPAPAGSYSLQVGAFSTRSAAEAMMSTVRAKDKSYPVSTVTLPDTAIKARYRVMVGPYPSFDDANRTMSRLKKDGFTAVLKR